METTTTHNPSAIPAAGPSDAGMGLNLRSAMQDVPARVTEERNGITVCLPTPRINIPHELLEGASDLNYEFELDHRKLQSRQLVGHVNQILGLVERTNGKMQEFCATQSELASQVSHCKRLIGGCSASVEQLVVDALTEMNGKLDTMFIIPKSQAIDIKMGVVLGLLAECGLISLPDKPHRKTHTLPQDVIKTLLENKKGARLPDYYTEKQLSTQAAQEATIACMESFVSLPQLIKNTVVELVPVKREPQSRGVKRMKPRTTIKEKIKISAKGKKGKK